ncbi:VOC family protein [Actinomycetes bacterium KLBMP 9797]
MAPRFDAIGLVTADMTRSLDFYRRLGLTFPDGAETEPHTEAVLPGGLRLMLDTVEMVKSIAPDWQGPSDGGGASLAFRCDDPADVDKTYTDLVAAGYHGEREPWDAVWGQRYAVVNDPDGNGIDLFAPL